jgi:5-methylcytosine-specific restriction endonuclease McrA
MYKTCSRCGKIHPYNFNCTKGKTYSGGHERKLRHHRRWTEKSEEIRERANYLCEVCRQEGIYTYEGLEVHHITKLSEDETGLLDNFNLICLCTRHHKDADNGLISADYLRDLARQREAKQEDI